MADQRRSGAPPYRSRVPAEIANTEFRFTERQASEARRCQARIEAWCADPSTRACDKFLQMAEAAGSSQIEGITPRRVASPARRSLATSEPKPT